MQVGHDQVGVEVEGKQSLKALVLLLGRLVDALDGGAADEVIEVAHVAPLRSQG